MAQSIRKLAGGMLVLGALIILLAGCSAPVGNQSSYVNAVQDQTQRAAAALNSLGGLATNPQFNDANWIEQANQELEILREVVNEAQALTPPATMAEINQTYQNAVVEVEQVTATVEQAIAAGDPALLQQAVPTLAEVEQLLATAQNLVSSR